MLWPPLSLLPRLFSAIGWLAIIAALTLPLIGMHRLRTLVAWVEALRLWMVVGATLGGLLL